MESGPEKARMQRFKLDRKTDSKRAPSAKRQTLERKKTRSLKRLSRPGTGVGNRS